jgi:hypothetical protein
VLGDVRDADLIVPASFRTGAFSSGVILHYPKFLTPRPDTLLGPGTTSAAFTRRWNAVGAGAWTAGRFRLDANFGVELDQFTNWGNEDTVAVIGRHDRFARLIPSVRVSLGDARLQYRSVLTWRYVQHTHVDVAELHQWISWNEPGNAGTWTTGVCWQPMHSLTMGAALRADANFWQADSEAAAHTDLALRAPVGAEFTTGILTLRVGAMPWWAKWNEPNPFRREVYAGLALRVHRNILLEFLPDFEDVTRLQGWELAASVRI